MASSVIVRLGGLVAMVGGLAATTLGLLYVLQARGITLDFTEKTLRKGSYEGPVANMLLVGALAAIAALHIVQRRHYGRWGAFASFAAFIGLVLLPVGWLVAVAWLVAGPSFTPALITAVLVVGVLAASVGIVGLGIVTMSAGVLPRWCGIALIAGSPPGVGILFLFLSPLGMAGILPGEAVWELAGILWIAVGYAIFRTAARRTERPARVR